MKRFKDFTKAKTANINAEKAEPEHLKNALVQAKRDLMAAKTDAEKEFHRKKIDALSSVQEDDSNPNKIRYTKYEPHTAYGFRGQTVLARRSGSSSGGDGGNGNGD